MSFKYKTGDEEVITQLKNAAEMASSKAVMRPDPMPYISLFKTLSFISNYLSL